jgi:hypothetical protein
MEINDISMTNKLIVVMTGTTASGRKQSDSISWTYFAPFDPTAPAVFQSNQSLFLPLNYGTAAI